MATEQTPTKSFQNATPRLRARHATRYEVVAVSPTGKTHIVGFIARVSKVGLSDLIFLRRDDLLLLAGLTPTSLFTFETKPRIRAIANGWTIGFSGRTERDAYYAIDQRTCRQFAYTETGRVAEDGSEACRICGRGLDAHIAEGK